PQGHEADHPYERAGDHRAGGRKPKEAWDQGLGEVGALPEGQEGHDGRRIPGRGRQAIHPTMGRGPRTHPHRLAPSPAPLQRGPRPCYGRGPLFLAVELIFHDAGGRISPEDGRHPLTPRPFYDGAWGPFWSRTAA